MHIALRYRGLKTLIFNSLSHKRSTMLARAWVRDQPLLGVAALNAAEPFFATADSIGPVVHLGVSLQEGFGGVLPSERVLNSYLDLYRDESHVLIWRDGAAYVVLKEGTGAHELLRVVWQAAWLQHHHESGTQGGRNSTSSKSNGSLDSHGSSASSEDSTGSSPGHASASPGSNGWNQPHSNGSKSNGTSNGDEHRGKDNHVDSCSPSSSQLHHSRLGSACDEALRVSVVQLQESFPEFVNKVSALGWKVEGLNMKTGEVRLSVEGETHS